MQFHLRFAISSTILTILYEHIASRIQAFSYAVSRSTPYLGLSCKREYYILQFYHTDRLKCLGGTDLGESRFHSISSNIMLSNLLYVMVGK
jgi:hypothetical protein